MCFRIYGTFLRPKYAGHHCMCWIKLHNVNKKNLKTISYFPEKVMKQFSDNLLMCKIKQRKIRKNYVDFFGFSIIWLKTSSLNLLVSFIAKIYLLCGTECNLRLMNYLKYFVWQCLWTVFTIVLSHSICLTLLNKLTISVWLE